MSQELKLPPRACIVTNVGAGRPQSFMLNTRDGVALMESPVGTMLDLYTAEQVTTAIAPIQAEVEEAKAAVVMWAERCEVRGKTEAVLMRRAKTAEARAATLKAEVEVLRAALVAARAQVVLLGGEPRKHPKDNDQDMIQFTVVELIDAALNRSKT